MAKLARKLWVGIGVASLAGAVSMPRHLAAQATDHNAHGAPPAARDDGSNRKASGADSADPKATDSKAADSKAADTKPGDSKSGDSKSGDSKSGEAGEAYLTDGGPKDTRIRFYRDIELTRGHLLVGQELIDMDLWDEALPHFLHPSEELYGLMEKYIKLHNMQPFGRELQVLAQTVKARRKGAYEQGLKPVHQRIAAALKVAKRFMRPERKFAVQSAVEVLRTAQSEYEGAMENGVFTKPVEYQDSRGFVWRAERVIEEAAKAGPQPLDAASLAKVRDTFARLKAAWPAPLPPQKPLLEVGQVSALISEIELYTSPITR